MTHLASKHGLCLVIGPPRSGTTLISDWIMEAADAYCVHEVLPDLPLQLSAEQIVARLYEFARTGEDRLKKPGQREFMNWDSVRTESKPLLLAWKEPLTGRDGDDQMAPSLEKVLSAYCPKVVLLQRHPMDVVASGLRRGKVTSNWPGYECKDLLAFWTHAVNLRKRLERLSMRPLCIRWETLATAPDQVASILSRHLGHPISASVGRERSESYVDTMKAQVHRSRGWCTNPARALVDRDQVAAQVGNMLVEEGYVM